MVRSYNLARGWNEDGMLPRSQVVEICGELELDSEGILTECEGRDAGLGVAADIEVEV
jgi:hypothetical protein